MTSGTALSPDLPAGPVGDYMRGLDTGDTLAAVAPFADAVEYIRPAIYDHESGVQIVRGRAELVAFFERRKGKPTRHVIRWQALAEGSLFGEGLIVRTEDDTVVSRFLFRAEMGPDERIHRYVAALA